jgi:hypothetical protein
MALTWFPVCKGARVCLLPWSRFCWAGLLLHWSQGRPSSEVMLPVGGNITKEVMQYIGKGQTVHTLLFTDFLGAFRKKGESKLMFSLVQNALLFIIFFGDILQTCSRKEIILEEANPKSMSGVFQNIDPPPPHRPPSVYPPFSFGAGGGHTRWVERGQYFGRRQTLHCTLHT